MRRTERLAKLQRDALELRQSPTERPFLRLASVRRRPRRRGPAAPFFLTVYSPKPEREGWLVAKVYAVNHGNRCGSRLAGHFSGSPEFVAKQLDDFPSKFAEWAKGGAR